MRDLFALFQDKALSTEQFKRRNDPLEDRLEALADEIPKVEGEIAFLEIEAAGSEDIVNEGQLLIDSWSEIGIEDRRIIVEHLILKITVTENEVIITLRGAPKAPPVPTPGGESPGENTPSSSSQGGGNFQPNPCPCGHRGDPRVECACSAQRLTRHRARLSGPWLDRVDLHVEVPAVGLGDLYSGPGESSAVVAERVAAARRVQWERFGEARADPLNGAMDPAALRRYCTLDDRGRQLLDAAHRRLGFSARARHRVLKVARTVADLAGKADVDAGHVAEAVQYRSLDRRVDATEAKT